ncbi:MAG TPA: hypothetical protein VJX67_04830 [Blastocatellia bacterium]|nr:hypothetical protein [Blastocatellia bacterium]
MAAYQPQTKRLIIAHMAGFDGTLEKVNNPNKKRQNNPFISVKGDGSSRAFYTSDPVVVVEAVTLSAVGTKQDVFFGQWQNMFEQQRANPALAQDITIQSFADDGTVLETLTLTNCVIQDLKQTDGDTGSHTETMCELIVQPDDIISE